MRAAGHGFWLPDSFAFLCHPDDLSNAREERGFRASGQLRVSEAGSGHSTARFARTFVQIAL